MTTMLTRDAILAASDLPRELVEVPEWGGSVYVATMTGTERDAFEAAILDLKRRGAAKVNLENVRAKLLVRVLVDEAGNRLFSDADAEVLGRKSAAALDRLWAVAQRLNAMTDRDVEDLRKN